MEQELEIKLIEGDFDVADANLLLMELLRFKIGFHEQKLFRDYTETNRDNSNSKGALRCSTAPSKKCAASWQVPRRRAGTWIWNA